MGSSPPSTSSGSFDIVVLWAVPRSRSTAFEKVMRTRGDHTCFHEPFGEPWYSGPEAQAPEQRQSAVPSSYTFDDVLRRLRAAAKNGPVFSKDFPHYVLDRWDEIVDDVPLHVGMRHSFLVRDPRRQIASMRDKWADLEERETGWAELRTLFERLTTEFGSPPPVIDADDLVSNPDGIVGAWCHAMGLEPDPDALTWQPSADPTQYSFYDGGSWHENLAHSAGLGPQVEQYTLDHTHPDIAGMVERALPHYELLYDHRLLAEAP